MPDTPDKYVRVYYRVRSDERLASIYSDDRHLAAWLRLLLDADAAWPAPASVPKSARAASMRALVSAGVVELLPHNLFRFHGLDAERAMRAQSGRIGAAVRWHSERSADAMPRRAETSKAKTSRDEQGARPNGIDHEDLSQEHAYGKHRIVQDLDCPLCYNQPQP